MADLAPGVVTVIGGSGFIGSQAVRALARRGWRIRVAVRNPVLAIEVQTAGDPGQIQFTRCDVTDPDDVAAALRGADAVVNLVGVLHDGRGKRGFDGLVEQGGKMGLGFKGTDRDHRQKLQPEIQTGLGTERREFKRGPSNRA